MVQTCSEECVTTLSTGSHLQGICSLPRLADKDTHVIPVNGRLPIQQV